jgi:ferrous iron transport protein A
MKENMSQKRQVTLARMHAGQVGKVVEILGGHGMIARLSGLGIRPGKKITKISSIFLRGPVTVQVGQAQVAIGFGMASHIIVEPEE